MSLIGVIASFSTGTYVVTRTATGTLTQGRYATGATSTFSIVASIQPVTGRDLMVLPEGRHATDVQIVYTTTSVLVMSDTMVVDGSTWEVSGVDTWKAFGNIHYRATIVRQNRP